MLKFPVAIASTIGSDRSVRELGIEESKASTTGETVLSEVLYFASRSRWQLHVVVSQAANGACVWLHNQKFSRRNNSQDIATDLALILTIFVSASYSFLHSLHVSNSHGSSFASSLIALRLETDAPFTRTPPFAYILGWRHNGDSKSLLQTRFQDCSSLRRHGGACVSGQGFGNCLTEGMIRLKDGPE